MAASACLTCIKAVKIHERIPICSHKSAQSALSKYFWFNDEESTRGILCQPCWYKISEFHQFYCEIEQLHSHRQQHPIQLLEVKQELNHDAMFVPELQEDPVTDVDVKVKCEIEDETEDDGGSDDDNDDSAEIPAKDEFSSASSQASDVNEADQIEQATLKNRTSPRKRRKLTKDEKTETSIKLATYVEKTFQCNICPKKFSRVILLNMHVKRHTREEDAEEVNNKDEDGSNAEDIQKNTRSSKTGRTVDDWKQQVKEQELIAQNVNLECDTCQQKANTFQELQEHSQSEHKKRANVFCCGQKYNRKCQLVEHIQFHLDPSQFQCDICFKQFQHKRALWNHKDKKHVSEEAKTFKCSECPKAFSRKVFLTTHEDYHRRLKEKTWHCQECDKSFAFESMLQQHNQGTHAKESNYVCYICAKSYQVLTSYTWHMQNSHGEGTSNTKREKPVDERVQCAECGASVTKRDFKKHQLRHTGTQRCDLCGQECKSIMALRWHKKQHNTPDIFCTVCGKAFKKQVALTEHMTTHTGEVLYSCDFCDKTFNSHANRASHRKKMHPKEWLEDRLQKNPHMQMQLDQQMLNQM